MLEIANENVQRKQRAALAWVEQINQLSEDKRAGMTWHYVLLGEMTVRDWHSKKAQLSDLLDRVSPGSVVSKRPSRRSLGFIG